MTALSAAAQPRGTATVSGYITDQGSAETLIGAGVLVEEEGRKNPTGAVTNAYGYYTLTIPRGKVSLQYSYVGYESQAIELDLRRDTTISIASGNNVRLQEAQIVQAAGKAIGINIAINAQEIATFRADFRALNFSIMINSAIADFPDADSIFAFQVDPEGFSQCYWTNYKNDEAIALLKAGQVTLDGDERAAIYEELQQILADDVPYIPFYYASRVVGVRDNIEGLVILPNGSADFSAAVKK